MIRILIIDNSIALTGALKSILVSTKSISNASFYLCTQAKEINGETSDYLHEIIPIKLREIHKGIGALLYFPFLLINTRRIIRIIKKNDISILHINDLYNMLGVMVKIFNPKIKLVYHVRLLPNSYASKLYPIWSRLIEKYADQIICVSEIVAKNFNSKATVIYDAIPFPEVDKTKISIGNKISFLYLANYTKGKGQEYAIEAFHQITENLPNAELRLYGGTFNLKKNELFKQELIDFTDKLKLQNKVFFNDFLQNPEEEIVKSDIMLNFSESESFSMTTLESLTYGTPVIVTDCGGPAEIIEDGVSGILVPVKDVNAMASQMIRLAKDPELRNKMSKNGIERAKSKFNLTTQSKKLADVYDSLISLATSPQSHESPKSAS